jgi:hypothetical protein
LRNVNTLDGGEDLIEELLQKVLFEQTNDFVDVAKC